MKKLLKCFIPLFFVAVLIFASPVIANASTWQCTEDYSNGSFTYKKFEYTPPLPLGVEQIALPNNVDSGGFFTQAGNKIVVTVMLGTECNCKISLFNQSTGNFVASENSNGGSAAQIGIVAPETGYYIPIIELPGSAPLSTSIQNYLVVANFNF